MEWYLDNVCNLNKEFPYTFYVPSPEVLDKLKIGDLVKLLFVTKETQDDGFNGERMWVNITKISGKQFEGELGNEPYRLPLKVGDIIYFGVENICGTEYDDKNSCEWDYYFDTKVIVSNDVLVKNEFNFLLRDDSKGEGDSGWSILSGYEDDEFLSKSENFRVISIGLLLNIDDSILEFIKEPPLCAYERNDEGKFYRINDYDWEGYLGG